MIKFSLTKQVRKLYQPKRADFKKWLTLSLIKHYKIVYIDVIIVSNKISQELNSKYHNKNYPTNVISLEYEQTRKGFDILNGELILCDDIIVEEATQQNISILEHYAHMVVHGVLHLQGLNHIDEHDAEKMEDLETIIMQKLGFSDPYRRKKL